MMKFAGAKLVLGKDVEKGDQESLQTLFKSAERYRRMVLLSSAEEDANVRVTLQGLGSIDLKLGDDMEKGQVKTIMTLFWFVERAKPIEIKRNAKAGSTVSLTMVLAPPRPIAA